MVAITKRSVLVGALATTAAAASCVPHPAFPSLATPDLWVLYREQVARCRAASAAFDAAEERLPWWAKSGPDSINSCGEQVGSPSGWPAIQDVSPPKQSSAFRRIRVGLREIKADYELYDDMFFRNAPYPNKSRSALRAKYRARVRDWIALVRKQRAEKAALGLPELAAAQEAAGDAAYETARAIQDQRGTSPAVLAGRIVFLAISDMLTADRIGYIEPNAISLLEDLRPGLTGGIASVVDELLTQHAASMANDSHKPTFGELSFWG